MKHHTHQCGLQNQRDSQNLVENGILGRSHFKMLYMKMKGLTFDVEKLQGTRSNLGE
jgi:hypothetical protein